MNSVLPKWPLLVVALVWLAGCASEAVRKTALLDTLSGLERSPSLVAAEPEDANILALGEEAREFIDGHVYGIRDPYRRIRALRTAVFDEEGLDFSIDTDLTLTADEAFLEARGNCVALANFFVAAVRYLGMDAEFQEVQRETAREDDGMRVVERHINVSGEFIRANRRARYVLDYLAVPEEDFGQSKVISDQRAFAHYYNNLAIQHLQRGDLEAALQYLKKAILQDADVDFIWSNMGVVYSRRGDFEAAEFAYRRALEINKDNPSAGRNLKALYNKWGGKEETKI